MKKLIEFKNISALLKNDKAVKIAVAVGFALIVIILLSDLLNFNNAEARKNSGEPPRAKPPSAEAGSYTEQLEAQLTAILSEIDGVGEVRVMITLESLEDIPRVRGAAVVCEGGDDVLVKQKVVETVSKVLGISTARVSVVN